MLSYGTASGRAGRSGEHASAAVFDRAGKLQDQARLADAGFAADERAGAVAARRTAPDFEQTFHLVPAADERKHCRAAGVERAFVFGCVVLRRFVAGDAFGDRRRLGHRADAHLVEKTRSEGSVFAQRSGAVAAVVAHRDDAPHHVLAPWVYRQHLAGRLDGQPEVGVAACLRDALAQAAHIRVAVALANGVEPLVVDLGQKVAAVQFDRFGRAAAIRRSRGEGVHVEPEHGLRIPGNLVAVHHDVPLRGPRQDLRKLAERRA